VFRLGQAKYSSRTLYVSELRKIRGEYDALLSVGSRME
jgi:hypothetical protein